MVITKYEATHPVTRNYLNFFVNSTQALQLRDIGRCAIHAIGADFLASAGSDMATLWSAGSITRAFRKIAGRFLGPIGVSIAVADFGLCLAGYDLF